jgi:hypothetical protein
MFKLNPFAAMRRDFFMLEAKCSMWRCLTVIIE